MHSWSTTMPKTSRSSYYVEAVSKMARLVGSGRPGLLVSIPLYRMWWRVRGLDFTIASTDELGLDAARANYHKDGGGPLLYDLVKRLKISPSDAALDLGSGKAGAMITLARFPFHRVDGVEIAPALVEAARQNLAKLRLVQCQVFLADATTFTDFEPYNYIFMYNPFPAVVLKQVLANLEASIERKPRAVNLLYSNPLHEDAVLASGTFKQTLLYEPYPNYRIQVYRN